MDYSPTLAIVVKKMVPWIVIFYAVDLIPFVLTSILINEVKIQHHSKIPSDL